MSWAKREAVTNLVVLGDEDGHKRKVGGLLIGMPRDKGYPDKVNYELVQKDGEVLVLSGSASLSRQINEQDIGKFVKCEFTGWGRSGNGKFKIIEVNVWEGEASPEMKAWPRYGEFNGAKPAPQATAKASVGAPSNDGFEDFDERSAPDESDLPF